MLVAQQGLFIDIEAVPGGEIFALGATFGETFRREAIGARAVAEVLRELRSISSSAQFIAGHNIISHDLPTLDAAFAIPELRLLPAIDTLCLSPLAFPRNPYHRLTKNDRLIRSSKSHPVRDCDSSKAILEDSIGAFQSVLKSPGGSDRLALTRRLLACADLPWSGTPGMDLFFSALGVPRLSPEEAAEVWRIQTADFACPSASRKEWALAQISPSHRAALAYVLAWLPVAGSDAVPPGWVRRACQQRRPRAHLRNAGLSLQFVPNQVKFTGKFARLLACGRSSSSA